MKIVIGTDFYTNKEHMRIEINGKWFLLTDGEIDKDYNPYFAVNFNKKNEDIFFSAIDAISVIRDMDKVDK